MRKVLKLQQSGMIELMLRYLKMTQCTGVMIKLPQGTHINESIGESEVFTDVRLFKQPVGDLTHLYNWTRPGTMYATSYSSLRMKKANWANLECLQKGLEIWKEQRNWGPCFIKEGLRTLLGTVSPIGSKGNLIVRLSGDTCLFFGNVPISGEARNKQWSLKAQW